MPEQSVAKLPQLKDERPRVLSMRFQEGGVQLLPYPVQSVLPPGNGGGFAGQAIPGLEMRLDTQMGGVMVRYSAAHHTKFVLVPMAHIKQLELAE
jgi:hypothetical protein